MTKNELIKLLENIPGNQEIIIYSKDHTGELTNIFVEDVILEEDSEYIELVI